jgi:Methyltransferase FkbM domain
MSDITLQINLSAGDIAYAHLTIPALVEAHRPNIIDREELYVFSSPLNEYETIQIAAIDSFCESHHINHIDILKIDVEGYELEVLRGAKSYLDKNLIRFIYSEVSFDKYRKVQQYFGEINELLLVHGFRLYGFYEIQRYRDAREGVAFCNALFINDNFLTSATSIKTGS